MRTTLSELALILALGLPSLAWAQVDSMDAEASSEIPSSSRFEDDSFWDTRLYWENDGSFVKPNNYSDRHYTNGIGGAHVFYDPSFARRIADKLPDADAFALHDTAVGVTFAQLMYTPNDITIRVPEPGDRPYAGYLYGGVFIERANQTTMDHLQLDLGLVGQSSQADSIQKWIHDTFDNNDYPLGWGTQIEDEPTVQLNWRRRWKLDMVDATQQWLGYEEAAARRNPHSGFGVEVLPQAGVLLGTVNRTAEGGAMLRAGWNLPDDFGPGRLDEIRDGTGMDTASGLSLYGFIRGTGRIVQYRLVIDGSDFQNSPGVDSEPLVGEFWGGLTVAYEGENHGTYFTYSQIYLTEQFEGQRQKDSYGAISLAVKFRF